MLLTISTTYKPATDLGFLLHKNPSRCQSYDLAFGSVHIFYPEAGREKCTMAMVLDIDPIEMIRSRRRTKGTQLEHYINDRPYAASSFMSVAIAQVLGSAMRGQCKEHPELVDIVLPLTARLSVLPSRGGIETLNRLFEPLGYEIAAKGYQLDDTFEEWGSSPYYTVEIKKETTVGQLLRHLYVLIPVLDNQKHYYVGEDEVEKLLQKGEGWLADHPERELIAKRYLKHQGSLAREALRRLLQEEDEETEERSFAEEEAENSIRLNEERLRAALTALKETGARRVIDMGCGEGKLLGMLLKDRHFEYAAGMDVSARCLERAAQRLHMDSLPPTQRRKIDLFHASLMYRDKRFEGFDAAALIEVIEHIEPFRLAAVERTVFEFARPAAVVVTTPNREYNALWQNLEGGKLRHGDHRFEWSREEFMKWSGDISHRYGYSVRLVAVGREEEGVGSPTQMAIFTADE